MKLLILSHNPDRASFRQRIGNYLPQLESRDVTCAVEKFPAGYFTRWKLFKQASEFDAVLLHKKTLNFLDARILRKHARRIIYDFDDAIMFSPRNPFSRQSSHFRLFARTAALADGIIAGNSYLAEQAKPFSKNIQILPTGLDTEKYNIPKPSSDGKIRLVWIGSKSTLAYLQSLAHVLEQIGQKYPDVILRIICDTFLDVSQMNVEKCGWSLQTEARDLAVGDIGLCPLPDDNFTRGKCGFKILQYFAAGLPAIGSPVGFNTELIQPAKTGLLAETPQQWYQALVTLINDTNQRQHMGHTARQFVSQYDFEVIGNRLCRLIMQMLETNLR